MKTILAALSLIIFFYSPLYAQEYPWQLRTQDSGVTVYTRKVDHSALLEFKGNVIVHAPLDRVVAFFEDEKQIPHWYYQCTQMDLVEEKSSLDKIYYFVLHVPWPVAERDSVFDRVRSEDKETGAVSFQLTALPERLPKHKGRIRVPYLKTEWRFTPQKDGTTEVYFQQHSDAGGSLPAFLANALVIDIPLNSLKKFKELVEK